MVAIIFPDGVRLSAPSFRELEAEMRADSWNDDDKPTYRDQAARRAWNWSRTAVLTEGTCKKFIESLEDAGMLRVEEAE
jgi:hypothetical protein